MICRLWFFCIACLVRGVLSVSDPLPNQNLSDAAMLFTMVPREVDGAKFYALQRMTGYDDLSGARVRGIRFYNRAVHLYAMGVDFREARLFFYEEHFNSIVYAYNFNSSVTSASGIRFGHLHRGLGGGDTHVSVDWMSHNVYWTDPLFKMILVASGLPEKLAYDYHKILLSDDLDVPTGIAVDPMNGHLYFSDVGLNPRIERATLKGENRTRLLSKGLLYPHSLKWDSKDERLYWIDRQKEAVNWMNFDGSVVKNVVAQEESNMFDLELFRDVVYVSDVKQGYMYTYNKTTGDPVAQYLRITGGLIRGLGVFHIETQPIENDYCTELNCSQLCISKKGGAECACSEGYKLDSGSSKCVEDPVAFQTAAVFSTKNRICLVHIRTLSSFYFIPVCILYTADAIPEIFTTPEPTTPKTTTHIPSTPAPTTHDIFTTPRTTVPSTPNGSGQTNFANATSTTPHTNSTHPMSTLSPPTPTTATTTTPKPIVTASIKGNISFLDINMKERIIYFATNLALYRILIMVVQDNSLKEEHLLDTPGTTSGLVYDWIDDNLYLSENDTGNIMIYNPETDQLSVLLSGEIQPKNIILLPHLRQLMWIAGRPGHYAIRRADVDGTRVSEFVDSSKLTNPVGLTRDTQLPGIVWSDGGHIKYASLNDGKISTIPPTKPGAYLLHMYNDLLIWTNLSDTGNYSIVHVDNVMNEVALPVKNGTFNMSLNTDLKILDQRLQPEGPHACGYDVNGCEQICLTVNSTKSGLIESECFCQVGYTLINKTRCVSSPVDDHFVLVGDSSLEEIYQISINGSSVQAIMRPDDGQPTGVLYDKKNKVVIYGVENDPNIKSVALHGDTYSNLGEIKQTGSYPYRFALDETTRNLYYTTRGDTSVVAVRTPGDDHITFVGGLSSYSYADIVVHPGKGYMFWSRTYPYDAVYRAYMDGENVKRLSVGNLYQPFGLAIDYVAGQLYVSDKYHSTITKCDFNGENSQTFFSDSYASIFDIVIDGTFLYYTSSSRMYVKQVPLSNSLANRTIDEGVHMGHLAAIDVYRSNSTNIQPESPSCLANGGRGDCSNICFPTPAGRTCACPADEPLKADGKTCASVFICEDNYLDVNVQVNTSCSRRLDAVCSFKCDSGYVRVANTTYVTCTNYGWDLNSMKLCEAITCPRSVPNVKFGGDCLFMFGRECSYECDAGYTRATEGDAVCLLSGSWNTHFCEALTCPSNVPGVIFNNACNYTTGSTCAYQCKEGFSRVSDQEANCQATGMWDSSLCTSVTCPNNVTGVIFSSSCTYMAGQSCSYQCLTGYQSVNSQDAACQATGKWDSDFCTLITCPSTVSNVVFGRDCGYTFGEQCSYQCTSGYERITDEDAICLSTGLWNTQFCQAITCPRTLTGVIFGVTCTYTAGKSCSFECQPGYQTNTMSRVALCQTTGEWPSDLCIPITCPMTVYKVVFDITCDFTVGSACAYNCAKGYQKIEDTDAFCLATGNWNSNLCKAIKCPTTVPNVQLDPSCSYQYGKPCQYVCNSGYTKVANKTANCLETGQWNSNLCTVVTCPRHLENVKFDNSCTFKFGDTCRFECEGGFKKETKEAATCLATGHWNDNLCSATTCPRTVKSVTFDASCSFRSGQNCSYKCAKGFKKTHLQDAKCLPSGAWDSDLCIAGGVEKAEAQKTNNTGPVVGGVVAGVVLIIAVVVGIFLFCRRRQKKLDSLAGSRAVFSGGSRIAIENPGYTPHEFKLRDETQQPTEAMHYIVPSVGTPARTNGTSSSTNPYANVTTAHDIDPYSTVRTSDINPYDNLKTDDTISMPESVTNADDVVLTQDSWLQEQRKIQNSPNFSKA